ncbi:DUF2255 family protein [Antribacter gilvus]|uniref:DUF2255 family protein n=1 Tax=Antribacter gilvus TaxID=2304675 RepID=UPI000F79AB15|nr:DUF2255 family protein [Antribacter gilvus]
MTAWTHEELTRIGRADELRVASHRPDGTLRPAVTIWTVRVGDDVYVRSAYGRDNGWFRRALASGTGHVQAGGVSKDVVFEEPEEDVHAAVDAAYHAKYDRYGPAIVGTVTGPHAVGETLRVTPRD